MVFQPLFDHIGMMNTQVIKNQKDSLGGIFDKPFHEFSYSSIFDMSDVRPGEIEIEDEIKMGYLWRRYGRHEPK